MESVKFGVHEVIDLRELLNFKITCLSEAASRLQQVENADLRGLIEQSMTAGTKSVTTMQEFLSTAATQMEQ